MFDLFKACDLQPVALPIYRFRSYTSGPAIDHNSARIALRASDYSIRLPSISTYRNIDPILVAKMTMEEPPHPLGDSVVSQNEIPTQQPRGDHELSTSKSPFIAELTSNLGIRKLQSQAGPVNANLVLNAKVPIPRQRANATPRHSRRVPRACESCRQRKTKCSGDTPVCRQCREMRISCQYPVGWREKTKRSVDISLRLCRHFRNLSREQSKLKRD